MIRSLIRKGDQTTRGGVVLEGDEATAHAGPPLAFRTGKIFCRACNSEGRIEGVGPFWPMTCTGGQQVALENDLCICKCDPHPRLVASRSDLIMKFDGQEMASMGYAPDGTRLPPEQQPKFISFKVNDIGQLQGLRCEAHFDDGSKTTGEFDYANSVRFDNPSGTVCKHVTIANDIGNAGNTLCSAFLSVLTA